MINQKKKNNLKPLLRFFLLKELLVSPAWIIFGYLLPIIFIIFITKFQLNGIAQMNSNYLTSKESYQSIYTYILYSQSWLGAAVLLPVAYFGILNLIFVYGPSKQFRMNKIYATLNVSRNKYLTVNFMINFIHTFIVINIILLIYNFGSLHFYKLDDFQLSAPQYFSFFFIGLFAFIFTYLFSAFISATTNSLLLMLFLGFSYYAFSLLTSGTLLAPFGVNYRSIQYIQNVTNEIGLHPILKADSYLRWLQYMTPIGASQRLNYIMMFNTNVITADAHHISIYEDIRSLEPHIITKWDVSAPVWQSDWLCFVSPFLQNVLIIMILMKLKTWRYHKDIKRTAKKPFSQSLTLKINR